MAAGTIKSREGPLKKHLIVATAALGLAGPALAQGYPDRPINFVVQFAPGGPTDTTARILAREMEPRLGQPVVINNVPGAAGIVGQSFIGNAEADGYTIGITGSGALTTAPYVLENPPYDSINDFVHITHLVNIPMVLCVRQDFPAQTLAEFVELARANPDEYTYGSEGIGASTRLAFEWFRLLAGIDVIHIPYVGGQADLMPDLLNGSIDAAMIGYTGPMPYHHAGQIRCLAVSAEDRVAIGPEIPTFVESGYPEFTPMAWFSLTGPDGIPEEIVNRLSAVINEILSDPAVIEELSRFGFLPAPSTPAESLATVNRYLDIWGEVIASGVQVR